MQCKQLGTEERSLKYIHFGVRTSLKLSIVLDLVLTNLCWLTGAVHNWHISMTVIVAYLLVSVALYSLGLYLNRSAELRGPQKASADEDVAAPLAS